MSGGDRPVAPIPYSGGRFAQPEKVDPSDGSARLLEELGEFHGVYTTPEPFTTASEEANFLLMMAESGIPVAGTVSESAKAMIGDELAGLITKATVEDLLDVKGRERLSVSLRRSRTTPEDESTTVTILLCTNRPDYLSHALEQVRKQTHPALSLVLVAHGEHFPDDSELRDLHPGPMEVVRVPSTVLFGEALNRGVAVSQSEFLTKMDDDDWYSPHHITDLLQAARLSGAPMVAKGAEFVFLDEIQVTIRRMSDGSDTFANRNVAGGTFMIRRAALDAVGGWRPVERHVDQALLDDMVTHDLLWYRTHGFGYILHRRSDGHTWDASIDYFLDLSTAQQRGLAVEKALVEA